MLLTKEQMKYLETDGNDCFKFVDDGKATKSEKEKLPVNWKFVGKIVYAVISTLMLG